MYLISFTDATVYAPLILIALLYMPTIIYTIVLGIQFHGWKNWISQTLNDPVYFIFPILTSISFYGKQKNGIEEENRKDGGRGKEVSIFNYSRPMMIGDVAKPPPARMSMY